MITRLKHIASLLLVVVFLSPSIVKLEHHHDRFASNSNNENHFDIPHDKCEICKFEFSVFSTCKDETALRKEKPSDSFRNHYSSINFSNPSNFSFLLRAPPGLII